MKIKKLIINDGKNDKSLAFLHDGHWVVIKKLLEITPNDGSKEYSSLAETADDLIAFLQRLSENRNKLDSLITKTDISKCTQTGDMQEVMPFSPRFYRDFMLSERHVINSSRGMVRFTMKNLFHIVRAYEAVFRRPFPALKPKKAFYENPIYYKGNILSFFGDGETITYPKYATLLDYELELGMIITKDIFNATEQEALDSIGAFCIFNDFSARNVQYHEMKSTGFGPCKSKDFANAISNVVVTPDEILPYLTDIKTRVFINGKLIVTGQMNEFTHSIGRAVSYASEGERVYAGEFMATGTIPNCCGMENGHLLERGDTIRLEIDRIGEMTNKVV